MNKNIEIITKQRECFRRVMLRHKLTAFAWARKAGISEATIRHYLSGKTQSISTINLAKLANVIDISPNDLISEKINNEEIYNKPLENKDLFIEVFSNLDNFIKREKIIIEPKLHASVLFAWYQLANLINQSNNRETLLELEELAQKMIRNTK